MKGLFTSPSSPRERELLSRYSAPKGLWFVFFGITLLIPLVEIPLILLLTASESVLRIQTLNGCLVIAGGLAWAVFMTLVFMYPLKRLTVYLTAKQDAFLEESENILGEIRDMARKWEERLGGEEGGKAILDEVKHASKALSRIADHFERPILKPGKAGNHKGLDGEHLVGREASGERPGFPAR